MRAGKKFAVCDRLWLQPLSLPMLHVLAKAPNDDEPETTMEDFSDIPQDELIKPKEEAELIFASIPEHLRPYVGETWFRERVSTMSLIILIPDSNCNSSARDANLFVLQRCTYWPISSLVSSCPKFRIGSGFKTKPHGPACQRFSIY